MKATALIFLALVSAPALAEKWNKESNPAAVKNVTGMKIVTDFDSLPLAGELSNQHYAWSDTYWASNKGGIAYRWQAEPEPQVFTYKLLSRDEVRRASPATLEKLSPAEKYDIFMGDYDYSLTKKVLKLYKPTEAWWEGICNGWSAAAISHAEPQRVKLMNKDGVRVDFGSTDVKALLSFFYAKGYDKDYDGYKSVQIGKRCRVDGKVPGEDDERDAVRTMPSASAANSEDCKDVNAGAFHLVLTNLIALQDRGFVADIDRFNDIWNQPISKYESSIVSSRAPMPTEARDGAVRVVEINTEMTYTDELWTFDAKDIEDAKEEGGGFLSMDPVTGTDAQTNASRNYHYTLEINSKGEIIGGEWISATRPDFLWLKKPAMSFENSNGFNFEGLNQIYRPVR